MHAYAGGGIEHHVVRIPALERGLRTVRDHVAQAVPLIAFASQAIPAIAGPSARW